MNKIKFLRNELSLSTRKLSELFSLSDATISHYENEIRDLSTVMIKKMADYFYVTIDYLLAYSDFGLFVHYKDSDIKFIINEADYLKYKEQGSIYYVDNKRFINVNKIIEIDNELNLSKVIEMLEMQDLSDLNSVSIAVPNGRADIVKKIISLNDEKFNAIKQMIELL